MFGEDYTFEPPDPTPLVPPTLQWIHYSQKPLYHYTNPDGLYLIRDNSGKQVACIEMKKRHWNSKIGFEQYALLMAMPGDDWKFKE